MTTTEKIKVKVNVAPKYKEIEVSFPYYVEDEFVLVKFFDRNNGIMVADYGFSKHIQYMDMPEEWLSFKPTTEEKFNLKFNDVMNSLINIKTNGDEKII